MKLRNSLLGVGAALHNHLLNDVPRIFFMHFWANGDAKALAQGLAAAVKQTNVQ